MNGPPSEPRSDFRRIRRIQWIGLVTGLAALWVAFHVVGGWAGTALGAFIALAYLACFAAWSENGHEGLDLRVLLRHEAWSFHDRRRTQRTPEPSETDACQDGESE